jgi:hypothetical protein
MSTTAADAFNRAGLQQLMQPHGNVGEDLYIEGYTFLAPLIGGFVHHIAEKCRTHGISKLFFLSREGWTFKRFWEKSMPALFPDGNLPAIDYLYVSRMALAGASCAYQGLSRTNADIAFLPPGNRDFRDLGRIFNLDVSSLVPHLQRYDLAADTCLSPLHEGLIPGTVRLYELCKMPPFRKRSGGRPCRPIGLAALPGGCRLLTTPMSHCRYRLAEAPSSGFSMRRCSTDPIPTAMAFSLAPPGYSFPTSAKMPLKGAVRPAALRYGREHHPLCQDLFEEACRYIRPSMATCSRRRLQAAFRDTDDIGGRNWNRTYFHPAAGIFDAAEEMRRGLRPSRIFTGRLQTLVQLSAGQQTGLSKTAEVANIRHKHHLDDFPGRHVPNKVHVKGSRHLWDSSLLQLSCNPLLRLKYFLRHLRERIKE